ncbi:zinc-dependent alcohol dehydrogenase [Halostagnicola sp. GCM10023243]|uniref:zinc-dependent alcohol dehydrogenase n=1 Tax=Halostagnicola sp. GCM10023243 TaxID=3252682 RepID=UPI003610DDB9
MEVQSVRMPDPEELELVERDLSLDEDEVLVETAQASICDADLRAWKGLPISDDLPDGIFEYPGHEGSGTVIEVGSKVREYEPGDDVMLFGPNNSFSSHFKAPVDSLQPAPDEIDLELASLGEPACVGIYGVFQSGVQPGDDVLITGLNFQGQIAVEGLKKKGAATVIAADHRDARLEVAKERGADIVANTETDDIASIVQEHTQYNANEDASGHASGDAGVDVSYHSCGYWNPHAEEYLNMAIQQTRDEGIVVSIPDVFDPIEVDLHRIHHHGMEARFPNLMHHGPEFLDRWVSRLMKPIVNGTLDIRSLVTDSYPISEANEAMEQYSSDESQIKVMLTP